MLMPFLKNPIVKRRGKLLDRPSDGNERCLKCDGACCRSFTDVELTWEEFQRLEKLGATRLQLSLFGPHRLVIDYNCEFLAGNRCRIYEHRPEICRRFTCVDDS